MEKIVKMSRIQSIDEFFAESESLEEYESTNPYVARLISLRLSEVYSILNELQNGYKLEIQSE